ncbi:MAG: hypothetical protein AAGL98_12330, partial [Planctomycetota bacterium]
MRDLGGTVWIEPQYRHIGQIRIGKDRSPFFGNALSVNSDAAAALAADKTYAAQALASEGLLVPRGIVVVSDRFRAALSVKSPQAASSLPQTDAISALLDDVGLPVFIKPNRGSEGASVTRVDTLEELEADLGDLLSHTTHARIEEALTGDDLRILVLEGQVRAAYQRQPFSITGDGAGTVRSLIKDYLSNRPRAPGLSTEDPRIHRAILKAGLAPDSVLNKGQVIRLLPIANLST